MQTTIHTPSSRIHPRKFALWVGMASIVMLFAAFTSAYIVKQAGGNWLEFVLPSVFFGSTVAIVVSSISLHLSYKAYKNQNETVYKSGLVITFLLGIVFMVCQYLGWSQLYASGVDLKANVSGAFTYLITGAHALHVLSGMSAVLVALLHAFSLRFYYSEKRKNRFELVVQYWHFLGALWVYLFVFMMVTK